MSESFEIKSELTENEKYIIGEGFKKIKNQLINEFKKKLDIEKDIDKKLLLKTYINNTKLLTPEIITFSNKNNKINAETILINGKSNKIIFYKKNLNNQTKKGLDILLYHEFEHYIGRDKQGKIDINNNIKELNTKILTFRHYMNEYNYTISEKGVSELFKKIKREIVSRNTANKYNLFSQSEEVELFWIYYIFKNKKEELLFYLETFVKKDQLKKEIYYA